MTFCSALYIIKTEVDSFSFISEALSGVRQEPASAFCILLLTCSRICGSIIFDERSIMREGHYTTGSDLVFSVHLLLFYICFYTVYARLIPLKNGGISRA